MVEILSRKLFNAGKDFKSKSIKKKFIRKPEICCTSLPLNIAPKYSKLRTNYNYNWDSDQTKKVPTWRVSSHTPSVISWKGHWRRFITSRPIETREIKRCQNLIPVDDQKTYHRQILHSSISENWSDARDWCNVWNKLQSISVMEICYSDSR
jgi:hypothetical protein